MATVLFWKCECGIEWTARYKPEGETEFTCFCQRQQAVVGSVIELEYLPPRRDFENPELKPAPPSIFQPPR